MTAKYIRSMRAFLIVHYIKEHATVISDHLEASPYVNIIISVNS